jgi:crotonobetainyl-CoA:carnitine CoA-transferase CaiB-like acyl-CoA transferase
VSAVEDRPLGGVRIIDLVRGPLAPITRTLAELGAQVDRIDAIAPQADDLHDLIANLGKHRHIVALDAPTAQEMLTSAHAIVADAGQPLDLAALRQANRQLVTMTTSDFGVGNAFSGWHATDPVLHALSGELSRSGLQGRAPLLPPGALAYQCAISQAAYALMVSIYHALHTGVGDHIDFSALDGAVQALDPGFGIAGSATMGKPAHLLARSRPPKGFQYPIFPCADGHVRICLLAKRQWRGMHQWMGAPTQFASPEFDSIGARYKSLELLHAIAAFFADKPRFQLEAEGQAHGVPISAVLTLEESIASDHVRERQALRRIRLADGAHISVPNGVISIDGARMAASEAHALSPVSPSPAASPMTRAFADLKVLDLGVIVVGAEQGRLFGDQGADVIKVESRAYPDGNRQSYLSYGLSVSFAAGHRNKRSLGINLRDPEGRALFLQLAAQADIMLSNFKPGTLESLGLDYDAVAKINPRIIMADSSAFGASGPWSDRMGYGPLVRAATGLTSAWRYDDDAESFSDSITIYPDHVAARIGAIAVIALLIRRLRTGRGGAASVAQSEVMLHHFAVEVARLSRGDALGAPDWPWAAYPARGDDEWCVVSVRDTNDWLALCDLIGFAEGRKLDTPEKRLAARPKVDAALGAWVAAREPLDVAEKCQTAGVPAAPMLRLADLPHFPYFRARGFYRVEDHPYLKEPVIAERTHACSAVLADPEAKPAPLMGEQSAAIMADWLGLSVSQCAALIECGVLEPVEASVLDAARAAKAIK